MPESGQVSRTIFLLVVKVANPIHSWQYLHDIKKLVSVALGAEIVAIPALFIYVVSVPVFPIFQVDGHKLYVSFSWYT